MTNDVLSFFIRKKNYLVDNDNEENSKNFQSQMEIT